MMPACSLAIVAHLLSSVHGLHHTLSLTDNTITTSLLLRAEGSMV